MLKSCLNQKIFLFIAFFLTGFSVLAFDVSIESEKILKPGTDQIIAQYFFSITRVGGFLSEPEKEPLEILRGLGQSIQKKSKHFDGDICSIAGFSVASKTAAVLAPKPIFSKDWDESQKVAVEQLKLKSKQVFSSLNSLFSDETPGLTIQGCLDPIEFSKILEDFVEKNKKLKELRENQISKVKERLLPLMGLTDQIALAGTVKSDGLQMRLKLIGNQRFAEIAQFMGAGLPTPPCSKFIDPESFIAICSMQNVPETGEVMEKLKEFPQTAIVEGYLASEGLSLQKDILPTFSSEMLVMINLDPVGDGGVPDIRGSARVKDPIHLLSICPGLKQLASKLGVFVSVDLEKFPTSRISFFLAPAFGVHVGLSGDLLLFSSYREGVLALAERIQGVSSGKISPFVIEEGTQRYWRVALKKLNPEIQRFLQSPLFSKKGIPPLSNITVAEELGDLILGTQIASNGFEIKISLPWSLPAAKKAE